MLAEAERREWQAVCDGLIAGQQTLLLASRSPHGDADISYAPYIREEQFFYIFVSELVKHTKNLLSHPQASLLFIQAEAESANLFARQRLTLNCFAREVRQIDPQYVRVLDVMAKKFGNTIDLLRTLPDFHLLALEVSEGQFVAGFGKTFAVDALGRIR